MVGAGDTHFLSKARARIEGLMTKASILVLASHNNDIIRTFCNRGICLKGGEVVFDGDVESCLNFYRDKMAAH
jgi:ABC-type polysaccharide/polyol phosphate transport system ATPase subunit